MEALNDFDFWITFALEMSKVFKNPKFRGVQLVRIDSFGASKCPKLISRKIWVTEKSWNFHILYSQLGCPGLYSKKKYVYKI